MPATAFFEAGSHALHVRDESVEAQALLELTIFPGRPHDQSAPDPQRRERGGDSRVVVEPVIGRLGKCGWTVVDIQ